MRNEFLFKSNLKSDGEKVVCVVKGGGGATALDSLRMDIGRGLRLS